MGDSLDALSWGVEPALINPRLPVNELQPDVDGESMDYWPSYSTITPEARAAYLAWLAAGRPGGAYVGYVFLWFYGVERRALVDAPHSPTASAEVPALLSEVERLLGLYGGNGSFRSYATDFLAAARIATAPPALNEISPPTERAGWDLPIDAKVALGMLIAEGRPIPAEWALAWILCHPESYLRTPAQRCSAEFAALFSLRYTERYGAGLKLKPNRSRLALSYRAASSSFRGTTIDLSIGDLPDVTRLSAPIEKLREVARGVTDELDSYSRYVGRYDDRDSLAAQALLPPELIATDGPAGVFFGDVSALLQDQSVAVVDPVSLVDTWPSSKPDKLSKKEAGQLAQLLGAGGFGVEPDVRFGGANLSQSKKAVLFQLPDSATPEFSDRYAAATVILHVAALVAAADGTISDDEKLHLETHLEDSLHLEDAERVRLRTHLSWLLVEQPKFAGLKKRLEKLDEPQRSAIARFLIGVACADGHVDPNELKVLAKLYPMLGLDPDNVYADAHALEAQSAPDGLVQVLDRDPAPAHSIPPPKEEETGIQVALAPDRVQEIIAESLTVAAALGEIFDESEPGEETAEAEVSEADDLDTILGLDEAHSTLVIRLAQRPVWPRDEFDELADRLGLLPAGAIEAVNDAAFSAFDEPLLEGQDPVEVNPDALEELMT